MLIRAEAAVKPPERFDDDDANALVRRSYRAGWELD